MNDVILVEGTFGGQWAQPNSTFRQLLTAQQFQVSWFRGWSTDIDGVPSLLEARTHSDWRAGGYAFGYFLDSIPYEKRNVICHSHGINPVLYQPTLMQYPIRRLISVCSPVRNDMLETAKAAKPSIGRWRHIADEHGDKWQRGGELFDGHIGWHETKWPLADENVLTAGIDHSGILTDEKLMQHWVTDGHFNFLRG